jgi:hypothetical protein
MRAKGLVARKSVHGLAVYEAAQAKGDVLGGVIRKLRGVLEIDGPLPVAAFTGSQILNRDEIAELEAILEADGDDR